MTPRRDTDTREDILRRMEADLSTLACHAAIELGRPTRAETDGFRAVRGLVKRLTEQLEMPDWSEEGTDEQLRKSLFDPTTVVVMSDVISSLSQTEPKKLRELLKGTERYTDELRKLIDDPVSYEKQNPSTLIKLREFCLKVAERAMKDRRSFLDLEMLPRT